VSIILVIFGLSCIVLSILASSFAWPTPSAGVLAAIGGSALAIGIVDLVVSFSTVLEYIHAVTMNLYHQDYLRKLSDTQLENLRKDVTAVILANHFTQETDNDFLLQLDENTLGTITSDYYLDSYDVRIHFSVDTAGATVTKRLFAKMVYIKTVPYTVEIAPIRDKNMVCIP